MSNITYKNTKFNNSTINLSQHAFYEGCEFINCVFEFDGSGGSNFTDCSFVNPQYVFTKAAGNTIRFLATLYKDLGDGGKAMVESMFESIRAGATHTN